MNMNKHNFKEQHKDNNGFIPDDMYSHSKFAVVVGIFLSVITFYGYFFLFYEQAFERIYWKNRFLLWKHLRKNQVRLIKPPSRLLLMYQESPIDEFLIDIKGKHYEIWIYRGKKDAVTLRGIHPRTSYIGIFQSSPIMKIINRWTVEKLDKLGGGGTIA
jgi:hypothetical protein